MPVLIDTSMTLADLVTRHPELARELEVRSLDYCCGGRRTLAEACTARGLDPTQVATELSARVKDGDADTAPWATFGPAELVDHVESVHHTYLHEELPRLSALATKVAGVHGGRHPELIEVDRVYTELRHDLEPHLAKEEQVLFPMIRELAASESLPSFHCGSLQNPIRVMLTEHDRAGELLEQLRHLTGGYEPPQDACGSYRALFAGLAQLESDTHLHVHKENNLLFPAVLELQDRLARLASA